ncbi:MAG: hypothetical protein PHC97_03465 [Patescibacteria group bacterium]|nr:hypothetical protein [Patescibacteria group bacterium]
MKPEQPPVEKEQTPEEIKSILESALKNEQHVDLVIVNSEGKPEPTPDLIVEELENDYAMMTYIDSDGDLGESIPLDLKRVKKATLRAKAEKTDI